MGIELFRKLQRTWFIGFLRYNQILLLSLINVFVYFQNAIDKAVEMGSLSLIVDLLKVMMSQL
jgi:hypothetical protein